MIYHLLLEAEVFSAYRGGAISRTIANIMRLDATSIAVCGEWDDTWGQDPARILAIPALASYKRIKGRRFLPAVLHERLLRRIFHPLLERVAPGDIVWCHCQPFFSAALARTLQAKGVRLIHHSESTVAGRATHSAFLRFTADAYIFCSEALRQEALTLFPAWKNTYAIHNGADEAIFYPGPVRTDEPDKPPTILYVGRLDPQKGCHVLLEAVRILAARNVPLVCRMVGSAFAGGSKPTPYVKALESRRPANVTFEGFYSGKEIGKLYRSADILCCPSVFQEPFGNVNVEAMASGIPVVATRVGGIPEIAAAGGVVLVEPDAPEDLAIALEKLLKDRQLREQIGAEGRQSFARRFTWPILLKKYQAVVDDLEAAATLGQNQHQNPHKDRRLVLQ